MIGELWAVAITLRVVLIENMCRLAVQITQGHQLRMTADALVDWVLSANQTPNRSPAQPLNSVLSDECEPVSEAPAPSRCQATRRPRHSARAAARQRL